MQTGDELTNLLRDQMVNISPAPGGDLLRDGSGVLPPGRVHALDPYRMPSPAYERGRAIAQSYPRSKEHEQYPETVAVMLWDWMQQDCGESLGILPELVGQHL